MFLMDAPFYPHISNPGVYNAAREIYVKEGIRKEC